MFIINKSIHNLIGGKFVEFGTENAKECNTRLLREKLGWQGLLLDCCHENASINLHKEIVLYSSVVGLFRKYGVDKNVDILSEDTDYADYWIVEQVLTEYKPKLIVHEVNGQPADMCVTVPRPDVDELVFWDSSNYHGGSVCAFHCLAKNNGYTMV